MKIAALIGAIVAFSAAFVVASAGGSTPPPQKHFRPNAATVSAFTGGCC